MGTKRKRLSYSTEVQQPSQPLLTHYALRRLACPTDLSDRPAGSSHRGGSPARSVPDVARRGSRTGEVAKAAEDRRPSRPAKPAPPTLVRRLPRPSDGYRDRYEL